MATTTFTQVDFTRVPSFSKIKAKLRRGIKIRMPKRARFYSMPGITKIKTGRR